MKLPIIKIELNRFSKPDFGIGYFGHRCDGEGCADGVIYVSLWKIEIVLWTRKGLYCS